MNEPYLMTIQEVAEYLRISERTVYDWAVKKKLPGGKIGSTWRFKRQEMESWLNDSLHAKPTAVEMVTLENVLSPERIFLIDLVKKEEVFNILTASLASNLKKVSQEELSREMFAREQLMSTGIGLGIGVPHVRMENIDNLLVSVGICKKGISGYNSLDNEPVNVVVMIAANLYQHKDYLKILSSVTRRLKDDKLRNILLESENIDTIYNLLIKY